MRYAVLALFGVWFFVGCTSSFAIASAVENDDFARASLQGLEGVYVAVKELDIAAGKNGLTTAMVRADTELALKNAGITVLSRQEWATTKGGPVCYVEVDIVHDTFVSDLLQSVLYAYAITVEFNQDVILLRNPAIQTLSPTWSSSYLGLTNSLSRIREKTKTLVNNFITAYMTVNPGTPFAQSINSDLESDLESNVAGTKKPTDIASGNPRKPEQINDSLKKEESVTVKKGHGTASF